MADPWGTHRRCGCKGAAPAGGPSAGRTQQGHSLPVVWGLLGVTGQGKAPPRGPRSWRGLAGGKGEPVLRGVRPSRVRRGSQVAWWCGTWGDQCATRPLPAPAQGAHGAAGAPQQPSRGVWWCPPARPGVCPPTTLGAPHASPRCLRVCPSQRWQGLPDSAEPAQTCRVSLTSFFPEGLCASVPGHCPSGNFPRAQELLFPPRPRRCAGPPHPPTPRYTGCPHARND